jgi:hypothetical protein
MSAIRFTTIVGADGIIRPPAGVKLPEGEVEVAVQSPAIVPSSTNHPDSTCGWLLDLAAEAERDGTRLPADIAEHHDHYAHGKPKS